VDIWAKERKSERLAQDSKESEGSSVGQPRGIPTYPHHLLGWGGTLGHSRVERKQLESVGYLVMRGVRKGQGWGFALASYPADAYAPQ
jgi:hypothetical protein